MLAAKVQIGRSARFIGQQAIQLHGGVGMTMEYKVGHYFKRLTMIDTMFGDADHHSPALAGTGGLFKAGTELQETVMHSSCPAREDLARTA